MLKESCQLLGEQGEYDDGNLNVIPSYIYVKVTNSQLHENSFAIIIKDVD